MSEMQPGCGQQSQPAKRRLGDPLPTISLSVGAGRTTGTVSIPGIDPNNPPPLYGGPGEADPQNELTFDATTKTWAATFANTDAVYTLKADLGSPAEPGMVTVTIPAANATTSAALKARPVLSVIVDDNSANGSLSCSVRESASFQVPTSTGQATSFPPGAASIFGKPTMAVFQNNTLIHLFTDIPATGWTYANDFDIQKAPSALALAEIEGYAFMAIALADDDEVVVYRTAQFDDDLAFSTEVGTFTVTDLKDGIGLASNGQGLTLTVTSGDDVMVANTQVDASGSTNWSSLSNPFSSSSLTFTTGPDVAAMGRSFVMAVTDSTGAVYASTQANPTAAWSTPAAVAGFGNATKPVALARWFQHVHLVACDSSDDTVGVSAWDGTAWDSRTPLPDTNGTWTSAGLLAIAGGPAIQPA